ncbi:hypothetical protein BTA51_22920 [Hahella sp. CCB-MM4]|uniref:DUF4136 domain-containing protein n=1 Tax=Hahella sp. (strain CCB-MM4) TaxID=1926491 RepID=UPI000B9AD176|nr:DUF4136 domain-containing protein [Hahella sp. CCB-MM4]OZG70962.1 hypothetical protein BTA51_22920 [Hahella sp. CCB-MM4]
MTTLINDHPSSRYSRGLRYGLLVLIIFQAVVSGCATRELLPAVVISPNISASEYSGFTVENASQRDGEIYAMLNVGINKVFTEKGYRPGVNSKRDLRVRYLLLVDRGQRLVEQVIPTGKGDVTRHYMEAVNEARFLVNVVDTATNEVVWKASTIKDISGKSLPSQEELEERLAEFFDSFPTRN